MNPGLGQIHYRLLDESGDGGTPADAGTADAGADAGPGTANDAGAGLPAARFGIGCGCRSSAGFAGAWLWLGYLAAACFSWPRRRLGRPGIR
jgi:hypothetical protein